MSRKSSDSGNVVVTVHDYKKDMQLSIQLNRWMMKPIGVWPRSIDVSWAERSVYILLNVICVSLIGFLFIPCAIYIALEVENIYDMLRLSGPVILCVTAVAKYFLLIYRENDIRRNIEHIENDWINTQHYDDRSIMIKNAKFGRRLVMICAFFMYSGAVFYYLAMPFSHGKITELGSNLTYRPLVYPVARMLIDVRYSPISEIFFWLQCISGFLAHSITAIACSLAAMFVMHACGRMKVLMKWIEHLVDGRKDFGTDVDERLAMIVKQHVQVIRFVLLTDKILREISVTEIIGCTLQMCCLGYCIIMEWQTGELANYVTYIIILIALTFNIFIFCYIGELIVEQFKKIGEVSYMIEWYRLPRRKGLALVLMIIISNSSIKLTAGNLFELSLSTFGDVSRTMTLLNILTAERLTYHSSNQQPWGDNWKIAVTAQPRRDFPCSNLNATPSVADEPLYVSKIQEDLMYRKSSDPDIVVAAVHDYKKDMQLSIQLNRWIMKPIGVWPRSIEISWPEKSACMLVNVICISLIGFLFIPCAIYIVLEVKDTYDMLKLSGPLSFCLMAIIKYSSLICRENDIRRGIEHIENDWMNTRHYDDRSIMIRNAKFGRRLVIICAFFMYGGAVFYYLAMPFSHGKITELGSNLTYRPLVYPVARLIVDARHSPVSEIFFWLQCVSGFLAHSITTVACSLAAVFVMHACGRMKVLMKWIEHLVDGREDFCNDVDERLAMIVQQHVRVLRFVSLTDRILREISIVEIVGCTLNMCFLGYYVIMEWETGELANYVTYTIILVSLTFNIFIFCYIGELIAEQCKKIGEMSYMIEWHRLPKKKGLALVLIIVMSNASIKLSAGNLFELSLSTFGSVVKTSVAYLNMLRTLTS
ncbi:uncharacterized protein LOC105188545 [Harpegnathos saltator]|uniref:uncharacterized protein LOC105188545 n=1 Tax=Harpegnathos saltator TaxID=610380 RepID=UPI000DBECFC9|nr:uncharacterized protein LOC105188545 [Harpegnathos saltator]